MSGRLFAAEALLPAGWARDVLIEWDAAGRFTAVTPGAPAPAGVPRAAGPVAPGMPNLHSHAFQRAFAGLTELRESGQDSFWTWRELMYRFALAVTPEQLEAIATWLYIEMVEAGYTAVCEFHYLHHDRDGRAYADPATLAACHVRAAARAGIGLTLLPVLYQHGGFGGAPATPRQRRFLHGVDSLLATIARLKPDCDAHGVRLGLAAHSLRAVSPESLREALAGIDAIDPRAPLHVHVAEQTQEVDDCLAWSGRRPVAWLLDHAPVGPRWCLVHATHMTPDEARAAARTGAVAGLCPTTEANLGDGVFDFTTWIDPASGPGQWGVGSDSHVTVSAAAELALLEYGQRLVLRRRNVAATADQPQVATALWLAAVAGGAAAAGQEPGAPGLTLGRRADFLVLDSTQPLLAGLPAAQMLSAQVFAAGPAAAFAGVWCGGRQVVAAGRHPARAAAAAAFTAARTALLGQI